MHATLEALRKAQRQCILSADDAQSISIRVNPRWLRVCDVKKPRTGLEVKFSFTTVVAMTLVGIDTASDAAYTDALCRDPRMTAIWPRVEVTGDASLADSEARLRIERSSGPAIETAHDLAVRLPNATLVRGLRRKAVALLGEAAAQRLWCAAADLETLAARDLGRLLQD